MNRFKKTLMASLMFAMVLGMFVGCSLNAEDDMLSGTYVGGKYTFIFQESGKCTLSQDGYTFNGTYNKIDDASYELDMKAGGIGSYVDTIFSAKKEGNNLRITGGVIYGVLFTKQ